MRLGTWFAAIGFAMALCSAAAPASAQDCMIGEVKMFAGNLPPVNEALAE